MTEAELKEQIGALEEPVLGGTLGGHGIVRVEGSGSEALATLTFPYPSNSVFKALAATIRERIAPGIRIEHRIRIESHTVQGGVERVPGVRNVVAVSSAKGGVGKSTVAANLAIALAGEGARTGLLDADIHGPSVPIMMGVRETPQTDDKGFLVPLRAHGVALISIGFLVEPDAAVVWRGPLVNRALQQLLRETAWDDLDYLVIDLPPGTGDVQLTLAQHIPVTCAAVVTTPQELALADARRGVQMFNKVSIPVLGVIENMGLHVCPQCGRESRIFGEGGPQEMCAKFGLDLLGSLPLDQSIREHGDSGTPVAAAEPDGDIAALYRDIALRLAAGIAHKSRDLSAAFPKIVVSPA